MEHVHDEMKNALGGGHLPSQHFNANAAWLKLSLIAYNIVSVMRRLALNVEERTVRLKKFRLFVILLAGRMSRVQNTRSRLIGVGFSIATTAPGIRRCACFGNRRRVIGRVGGKTFASLWCRSLRPRRLMSHSRLAPGTPPVRKTKSLLKFRRPLPMWEVSAQAGKGQRWMP